LWNNVIFGKIIVKTFYVEKSKEIDNLIVFMHECSISIFYKKLYTFLRLMTFVVLAAVLFTSCKDKSTEEPTPIILSKATSEFKANLATRWTDLQLQLIKSTPGYALPVVASTLGYTSLALYESLGY